MARPWKVPPLSTKKKKKTPLKLVGKEDVNYFHFKKIKNLHTEQSRRPVGPRPTTAVDPSNSETG